VTTGRGGDSLASATRKHCLQHGLCVSLEDFGGGGVILAQIDN